MSGRNIKEMDITLKIKTFLKSLFFHISKGMPRCTKKEVLFRYNICIKCSEFIKEESQCGVCGCNLSNKVQFMNKLAWADQKCPKDYWPSIERPNRK